MIRPSSPFPQHQNQLPGRFGSMRVWLHGLALLALVFVFAVSIVLLGRVIGSRSPWLAVLLMCDFLAVAKFAQPLIVLRMPRSLYRLRPWELEGEIPRRLGILGFGKLLRETPLRYLNLRVYLGGGRDVQWVRAQAASAEASHFWAAVLFAPFIAAAAFAGRWNVVAWFTLAQLLGNVYPILHLRYVRGRLDRILRRVGKRKRAIAVLDAAYESVAVDADSR